MRIPFNKPYMTGQEIDFIQQAHQNQQFSGNGPFTQKCHQWLCEHIGCPKALLTHTGTAALEMCAILLNLKVGDEVIMPSFTFVSTANAFVLRGAIPVFVDIRKDTLNIDERKVERAITSKTKAIVAVHYAGVACDMDALMNIAERHQLTLIEDAAHGLLSYKNNHALGSIGHLAAVSFHETKNVISGEGGALLINDKRFMVRADIISEKGTDRRLFEEGKIDKYSWVDKGSSYFPSELTAAFLWAQMQAADHITKVRSEIWEKYHAAFQECETQGLIRRPVIPPGCRHNGHIYYILLKNKKMRDEFLNRIQAKGIGCVFHYIPLHSSKAGQAYGQMREPLPVTEDISFRIARLPLWVGLEDQQQEVISTIISELQEMNRENNIAY